MLLCLLVEPNAGLLGCGDALGCVPLRVSVRVAAFPRPRDENREAYDRKCSPGARLLRYPRMEAACCVQPSTMLQLSLLNWPNADENPTHDDFFNNYSGSLSMNVYTNAHRSTPHLHLDVGISRPAAPAFPRQGDFRQARPNTLGPMGQGLRR